MKRSGAETKLYCPDCPDPEACHQGASCEFVRGVVAYFANLDALATGKGITIMSNTQKLTVTPADVAEKAKEDKLVTEVPAQTTKSPKESKTGDKELQDVEATDNDVEDTTYPKPTVKDRLSTLVQKAKDNRQFFVGVVSGVIGTFAVATLMSKDEKTEVVELVIADEPEVEVVDSTDESAV
jgi:hypothetical protein